MNVKIKIMILSSILLGATDSCKAMGPLRSSVQKSLPALTRYQLSLKKYISSQINDPSGAYLIGLLKDADNLNTQEQQEFTPARIQHFLSKTSYYDIKKLSTSSQKALHPAIISHGPEKLILEIMERYPATFSEKDLSAIVDRMTHKYESFLPLHAHKNSGPLFSDFFKNNPQQLSYLLHSYDKHPRFFNLLPAICNYVQKQYDRDRIVLFHGQKAEWILLEKIYSALFSLKNNRTPSPHFRHLRFKEHATLSEQDITRIQKEGAPYKTGIKTDNDTILFTNLHLFANDDLCNSWYYACSNYDFSEDNFYEKMLIEICTNLGMLEEYKIIKTQQPKLFNDLYTLFTQAVEDHGNLIVISMTKEIAQKLTYSTNTIGTPRPLPITAGANNTTTDICIISDNYNRAPRNNTCAVVLSEEIINPEVANKAGVEIVSFDPAFYWKTEKSKKVMEKLDEIIKLINKEQKKHKVAL